MERERKFTAWGRNQLCKALKAFQHACADGIIPNLPSRDSGYKAYLRNIHAICFSADMEAFIQLGGILYVLYDLQSQGEEAIRNQQKMF